MRTAGLSPTVAGHRLVRASAGTGKTYRLTVEFIRQLTRGARADEILATTFTRKAAGEILERVLSRLAEGAVDPEAAARLGADLETEQWGPDSCSLLLVSLAQSLHRVNVATLDAFFYRILQRFRLELDVPATPVVLAGDDPRLERIRRRAIGRVLEELADDGFSELLDLLDRLHGGKARRSVAEDLDRLFVELHESFREAPEAAAWRGPATAADLPGDPGDGLRRLESWPMPRGARQAWRADLERFEAGEWSRFLERGLAAKLAAGDPRPSYRSWALPPELRSHYGPAIDHARGQLLEGVRRATTATRELLERFERLYAELRRQRRIVLFSDLAWRLSRELPMLAPERLLELYYRLDARVGHLLLDEFQDTSLDQWRVLEPIAEEIWAYGDGSRSFFCVGDPKQAIYGWRGGCADLFDVVAERLRAGGGCEETLAINYRSSPVVLELVERVFPALSEVEALADRRQTVARWLSDWTAPRAADEARPGYVELTVAPQRSDASEAEHDFGFLAETVEELSRTSPGASIGILVRTNRAVTRVLDALRRRGIRASGEGGAALTDDPCVTLVLSALLLADHPAHGPALQHVLQSPLGETLGLSDPSAGLVVARSIRRAIATRGLAPVVAEWSQQLSRLADLRSATRLAQLVRAAEEFESFGGARLAEFVDYVRGARFEEPQPSPIRVMTVHKSKGLEFDAVVLGELERRPSDPSDNLLWTLRPTPTEPPVAVYRSVSRAVAGLDPELARAREQESDRLLWDALSSLYVASTRARHALHLVVEPPGDRPEKTPSDSWASWLAEALLGRPLEENDRGRLYERGDRKWAAGLSQGVSPESEGRGGSPAVLPAQLPEVPRRNLARLRPSSSGDHESRVRVAELLRLDASDERLRGSLLHAWLAEIEWLDRGGGLPPRAELWRIARRLAPRVASTWIEARLLELEQALRTPEIEAALSSPARVRGERVELWRERPFALMSRGRLWHGRFDRVVVSRRRGEVLGAELYDFKSDRVSAEDSLETVVSGYRDQLGSYREALAAMLGVLPTLVRSRLVFLDVGRVVELGAQGGESGPGRD